ADVFIFLYIKSLHIDRSAFTDNSKLNVESLIKNLKNMIMKKLSMLCITESFTSLSILSVSFSAALSQSSTLISVSDSLTSAISASITSNSAMFASAYTFITSSSSFKKILYKLNKSHFSVCILSFFLLIYRIIYYICVFTNENTDVILLYTHRCETFASVSEIILIKDDNTAETTLFCSQASLSTFSLFSVEKIVCIL
ncbi:hypothetical protein BDBG_16622, partial [Blastomyces gilchristii SLH14081]